MDSKLREIITEFFTKNGFVYRQYDPGSDGSDCCENASTAYTFKSHDGSIHFLPQTRQLKMEYDVRSGKYDKVWTWDWSHRNESRFGDGRHERFFPLIEFEYTGKTDIADLINIEKSFLSHVAAYYIGRPLKFATMTYEQAIEELGLKWLDDIDTEAENKLLKSTGADALFIRCYPEQMCHFTMAQSWVSNLLCDKVDVILPYGGETIGSAVRSTDPDYLNKRLYSSDMFKGLVDLGMPSTAFDPYFQLKLTTPAMGGGIGFTRLEKWIKFHLLA